MDVFQVSSAASATSPHANRDRLMSIQGYHSDLVNINVHANLKTLLLRLFNYNTLRTITLLYMFIII